MVDERQPYQGEQLTATYKLYIGRVNIAGYQVKSVPQFNGFWKELIKDPKRINVTNEVINGKRYKTAILKKVALFPQRGGELTLDPFRMQFKVRYRDPDQERKGFFQRGFGGGYKTKKLAIASKPVSIDVKALPPDPPSSFSGLVGNLELNSSLNKKQTMTNNPVSLTVNVSGRANLSLLQPFDLNLPPVFESYSPQVKENLSTRNNIISGRKQFEYLLIPRSPGRYKIDPVALTYFNPQQEKYVTHKTPRYTIRVNQGARGADSATDAQHKTFDQQNVEVINKEIRDINTGTGNLKKDATPFVFSGMFWTLSLAPFLLFGGLLFYRRQQFNGGGAPLDARAKKARKLAQEKLKEARIHRQSGNQEGFFEALSKALWGYAGDKMNIPMAEMTQAHIRSVFRQKGIEGSLINELLSLIDSCEQARYAPSMGQFDMEELYRKAEITILSIEHELP